MVIGLLGGIMIISFVYEFILNVIEFDMIVE